MSVTLDAALDISDGGGGWWGGILKLMMTTCTLKPFSSENKIHMIQRNMKKFNYTLFDEQCRGSDGSPHSPVCY